MMTDQRSLDPRRTITTAQFFAGIMVALCASGLLAAAGPLTLTFITGKNRLGPGHILYFLCCFVAMVLPGAIYLALALTLPRRRRGIIIAGIVACAMHILCAIAGIVLAIVVIAPASGAAFLVMPLLVALGLLAVAAALLRALVRCLRTRHLLSPRDPGRFHPLPPPDQNR